MYNDKVVDNNSSIITSTIDLELEAVIGKRIAALRSKVIVVGSGITSSHLGDERNLREFLVANSVSNYLREKDKSVSFLLFDDSYDPLDFRQLRVAVNKDENLIKKFEKYCGIPIKHIPDPYGCHLNYSLHYQTEILKRFYSLDIHPSIVDSYSVYNSGLYDFAKEIVFTKYKEIKEFLKKEFPGYTMKKLFYPVCSKCSKMEGVNIEEVKEGKIKIRCTGCEFQFTKSWKNIRGKFSWKIDAAVKWNVFKTDFEAFSKAYLDPDVGSYFIAKKLSEQFFGGHYPEIIHYGQVLMDKSLSYKLLDSLPKEIFHALFLTHRKKDLTLSDNKIIKFAQDYKIDDQFSYYSYVISRLQNDLLESINGDSVCHKYKFFFDHGLKFAKHFLKRELCPKLPDKEVVEGIDKKILLQIKQLIEWVALHKIEHLSDSPEVFSKSLDDFIIENKLQKAKLFPSLRKLLSQEHSVPLNRILYFVSNTFLCGCLLIITQELSLKKND